MKSGLIRTPLLAGAGLLLACFLGTGCFFAVMAVAADAQIAKAKADTKFTAEQTAELKATQSHFVLTEEEWKQKDLYEQHVRANWTYTPIDVIRWSDAPLYFSQPAQSFFVLEGLDTEVSGSVNYTTTHLYWTLMVPKFTPVKKGKFDDKSSRFTRFELSPTPETLFLGSYVARTEKSADTLYRVGQYFNDSPVMLGFYLCEAQRNLQNGFARSRFNGMRDEKELAKLAKQTLYIPESVFRTNTGRKDKMTSEKDIKAILKSYPHRYEIVPDAKLAELALKSDQQVYVLDYVQSSTDKFVSIYKSRQGLIYHDYTAAKYKLKARDFGKIFKKK